MFILPNAERKRLEPRPLTFVHLSDIHFQSGLSEVSKYDLDSPLRHAILRDLKQLRERDSFNHFDGILISGDIAYAGKPDEYAAAIKWLNEIAEAIGCDRCHTPSAPDPAAGALL